METVFVLEDRFVSWGNNDGEEMARSLPTKGDDTRETELVEGW